MPDAFSPGDSNNNGTCGEMPPLAPMAMVDPAFASDYQVYVLGPVPGGLPPLGGSVISSNDPNTLLIAGGSETASGGIYAIKVRRNSCGHIVGFDGTASLVATTPWVDASLLYAPNQTLLYTQWPGKFLFSELSPGSTTPDLSINLQTLGMMGGGLGSMGFVPSGLTGAHGLRAATQPEGYWYHLDLTANGNLYSLSLGPTTATLPHWPGGFAYVPAGSPGFTNQSLIIAEWDNNTVATYQVDDQGDPVLSTRQPFINNLYRPWGAYFEPTTGDYLFLSWGAPPDQVYIVEGFVPPVLE
jgi:hypothetical protein